MYEEANNLIYRRRRHTSTREIENSTKLALSNKFNNGKRFLSKQTKLASISVLTNLSENNSTKNAKETR